jgi:prepilin-type N-terminal cleavage/methylation domain-containing protein
MANGARVLPPLKTFAHAFSLIEPIVVIAVLGTLAVFAVPRFARLDSQARVATVRSLERDLRNASVPVETIVRANTPGRFTVSVSDDALEFRINGAPGGGAHCRVTYIAPANANAVPNIVVDVSANNC